MFCPETTSWTDFSDVLRRDWTVRARNHRRDFATHRQAKTEIFDYIEAFYNRNRIHTSSHGLSPARFELINN